MENIELINENKQIEAEIIDKQPKSEELSTNSKVIFDLDNIIKADNSVDNSVAHGELVGRVEYVDDYTPYSFINYSSKTSKYCFNICKCLKVRSKVRYNDGKGFVNNNSNTCICETTCYELTCDCKICK